MTLSRRSFIRASGFGLLWRASAATGTGIVMSAVPAVAAPKSRTSLDLASVTAETFRPHVGTGFRVLRDGKRLADIELRAVSTPSPEDQADCFSLGFITSPTVAWHQDTYGIEHSSLGSWRMFLVPLGTSDLEAVVNHVRS